MSLWNRILSILAITCSITTISAYSTAALAVEDKAGSRKATEYTIEAIEKGIEATKSGSSAKEIKAFYFDARQESKDITGETIARDLQHGADALFAVSRSLKLDDINRPLTEEEQQKTLGAWDEALKIFKAIQKKQH